MTTIAIPGSPIDRVKAKLEKPGQLSTSIGIVVYGRTKSGKTSLLSTMPGNGFVIDVRRKEGGTNVLRPWADRIDVYPILQWRELDDVMAYLKNPGKKYHWVALDTITGLMALAEEATIGRMRSYSAIPRSMQGKEWGQMGARIIRIIDELVEMDLYTIILAQEKRREVADLGNVCAPDVIPMLLTPLTQATAMVCHISVANIGDRQTPIMEYQMRIKAHPSFYTGIRVDPDLAVQLPDVAKDPNLRTLIRFYYGKGGPPEAATPPILGTLELEETAPAAEAAIDE